jgi:small-conductance mechanosensitive channel
MLLTVTGILILGGLVFRLLMMIGLVKRLVWLLPILIGITAGTLVCFRVTDLYEYANLFALVRFLFIFLIFVSILYPVARLVMPASALRTRASVPPLLRGLAVGLVAFIGMFVLLNWFFPRLSLTPMFVTSGVVSIVVGLAIQDPLSNLLAGVLMTVERPFRIGDWVRIGDLQGEVVTITWRATRIRTRENDYVLIPNSVTAKESLINFDRPNPVHMLKITVGVAYDTPCALATDALVQAARGVDSVLSNPAPSAHLIDFADSAQIYELRIWMDNYESAPAIESDVRKRIWYAFKQRGITIPFPQHDVHMIPAAEIETLIRARIVSLSGPVRGVIYEIGESGLLIGRDTDCDIVLPDPRVSHQHARINAEKDGFRLRDLDSRHGTVLNGEDITAAILQPGDQIAVGGATFVFESNQVKAHPREIQRPQIPRTDGQTDSSHAPPNAPPTSA